MTKTTVDRTELALKLIATAAAAGLFAALGAGILHLTPAPWESRRSAPEAGAAGEPSLPEEGGSAFPLPPSTVETFVQTGPEGELKFYESRLGAEDIRRFYSAELPRRGWRQRSMTHAPGAGPVRGMPGGAMYFSNGGVHCIISIEERDAYVTRIAVLKSGIPAGPGH